MRTSVRNVARRLRKKGHDLGTVVRVVSPIRYQNRWRSKIQGID